MLFTENLLTSTTNHNSEIGTVWLLATVGNRSSYKKLLKKDVVSVSIPSVCNLISEQFEPLTLRLSSNLLYGVSLAYKQKINYFYIEANSIKNSLQKNVLYQKTNNMLNNHVLPITDLLNINGVEDRIGAITGGVAADTTSLGGSAGGSTTISTAKKVRLAKHVYLGDDTSFDISKGLLPPQSASAFDEFSIAGVQQPTPNTINSTSEAETAKNVHTEDSGDNEERFNDIGHKESLLELQRRKQIKEADMSDTYNISLVLTPLQNSSNSGNSVFSNFQHGNMRTNEDNWEVQQQPQQEGTFHEPLAMIEMNNNDLLGDINFEFDNEGDLMPVVEPNLVDKSILKEQENPEDIVTGAGLIGVRKGPDDFVQNLNDNFNDVIEPFPIADQEFQVPSTPPLQQQQLQQQDQPQEAQEAQLQVPRESGSVEPERLMGSAANRIKFDSDTEMTNSALRHLRDSFTDNVANSKAKTIEKRLHTLQTAKGGVSQISITGHPVNANDIILEQQMSDLAYTNLMNNLLDDEQAKMRGRTLTETGIADAAAAAAAASRRRSRRFQQPNYDSEIEIGRNRRSRSNSASERNSLDVEHLLRRSSQSHSQPLSQQHAHRTSNTPEVGRDQYDPVIMMDSGFDLSFSGFDMPDRAVLADDNNIINDNIDNNGNNNNLFADYSNAPLDLEDYLQTGSPSKKARRTSSVNQALRSALYSTSSVPIRKETILNLKRKRQRRSQSISRSSSRSLSRSSSGTATNRNFFGLQNDPLYERSHENANPQIEDMEFNNNVVANFDKLNDQVKRFICYLYTRVDIKDDAAGNSSGNGSASEIEDTAVSQIGTSYVIPADQIPRNLETSYKKRIEFGTKLVRLKFDTIVPAATSAGTVNDTFTSQVIGDNKDCCSRSTAAVAFSSILHLATTSLIDISCDAVEASYIPAQPDDISIYLNY